MYSNQQWNIVGHNAQGVANIFVVSSSENPKLAVLFPGYAYSLSAPLFYYSAQVCLENGYDVLGIDYRYNEDDRFRSSDERGREVWFSDDIHGVYDAVREHNDYEKVVFIGKSLGTTAMVEIAARELPWQRTQWIWLTPANAYPAIAERIRTLGLRSLIVYGDADPEFQPEVIDTLKGVENVRIEAIAGGDHGLDIADNVVESVRALSTTVSTIAEFIR